MVKNALVTIFVLPVVFFACLFVFAQGVVASGSDSLKASVEYAKSQDPKIDRTTIRGSIVYAKYQGEIIEQDKFVEEVLGVSETKGEVVADATTLAGSIQIAKQNKTDVLGDFDSDISTKVVDNVESTSLKASIQVAKTMPKRDQTTLSGSIMTALSYGGISQR